MTAKGSVEQPPLDGAWLLYFPALALPDALDPL
jgi:hypothetical protein